MDSYRSAKQRRISSKQEKAAAASLGGRRMAASGATRLGGGGDVRAPGYRIECKYTENPTYRLKQTELDKLTKQAFASVEQPILQLAFVGPSGRRLEFAFVRRMGPVPPGTPGYINSVSWIVSLEYLSGILASGSTYVVCFKGDNHYWIAKYWADFLKETEEERC